MQSILGIVTAGIRLDVGREARLAAEGAASLDMRVARVEFIRSCLIRCNGEQFKGNKSKEEFSRRAERMLTKVWESTTESDVDGAIADLLSLTTDYADWTLAKLYLARLWIAKGQFKDLERAFVTWFASSDVALAAHAHYFKGVSLQVQRRTVEAYQTLVDLQGDKLKSDSLGWLLDASLASVLFDLGRIDESRRIVEGLGDRPEESDYNKACLCALRGNRSEAVSWLRKAIKGRAGFCIVWCLVDPDLRVLRGDPEFERLVTELVCFNRILPPVEEGV